MLVKTLIRLGGYSDVSEDSDQTGQGLRFEQRSFCWFCQEAAHLKDKISRKPH